MIDMASVYAAKYKQQPDILRAAVMGQSPDRSLDPYTALNALKKVNESNMMAMAMQAQQPTSSPSLVAENMAPQMGLGAMVPGAMGQMGQMGQAPQGMPPQGMPPQGMPPQGPAPVMQRSGGLAGLPTPEPEYAAGGIVAFQSGGLNAPAEDDELGYLTGNKPELEESEGNASAQDKFNAYLMKQLKDLEGYEPKDLTEAQQDALYEKFIKREEKYAGPNIYKPAEDDLKTRREAIPKNERYGQGLALLGAAGQVLKGRSLAEGAGNALPAFAQQMAEVKKATIQEQRSIEQMQFSYADAQRKEKVGNHRAAVASMENARKFQQDANKAKFDKRRALADLAVRGAQANRPRAGGAGANPKYQEQILQNNVDYLKTTQKPKPGETPEAFDARIRKQASDITAAQLKTSFSTSENAPNKQAAAVAPVQQRVDAAVAQDIADFKLFSPEGAAYRRAMRAGGTQEAARLLKEAEKGFRATHERTQGLTGAGEAAPGTAANPIVIK